VQIFKLKQICMNRETGIRIAAIVMVLAFGIGCGTIKMTRLGKIDKSDKSVTIPPGSDDFMTTLKVCLTSEGWRIENFAGAEVTSKTASKDLKYDSFNTRYVLAGEYKPSTDKTIPRLQNANFSLIDVRSRNEIALFAAGQVTMASFCEKLTPQLRELEQ